MRRSLAGRPKRERGAATLGRRRLDARGLEDVVDGVECREARAAAFERGALVGEEPRRDVVKQLLQAPFRGARVAACARAVDL